MGGDLGRRSLCVHPFDNTNLWSKSVSDPCLVRIDIVL